MQFTDLQVADLRWANLQGAKYNAQTQFPDNFEPQKQGLVFMSE